MANLVLVVGNGKFFPNNIFFSNNHRNKNDVLRRFEWKPGIACILKAAIWLSWKFSEKWTWKTKYYRFFCKPIRRRRRQPVWKKVISMSGKLYSFFLRKNHLTRTKEGKPKHIETAFSRFKNINDFSISKINCLFSLQLAISAIKTHDWQQYFFFGQANLFLLSGFLKVPRQILTNILIQKWLQLFRCKSWSFQDRLQQRLLSSPEESSRTIRFQTNHAIERSTDRCCRKLRLRLKLVPCIKHNNV